MFPACRQILYCLSPQGRPERRISIFKNRSLVLSRKRNEALQQTLSKLRINIINQNKWFLAAK